MKFFKFISDIFNVSVKANRIKNDEERRPKSVHFAVTGSIYALVALALAIGGGFILKIANDSALIVFFVVIGVVFIFGALLTYIGALVRVIAQLGINRRAASFIALALFILCVAGGVIGVFLLMG